MLIDSRTVILEVKKHQCLYDPSREEACNRALKANAWMEVTKSVVGDKFNNMTQGNRMQVCTEVQKRWRHLRDSYVKAIRYRKNKPYVFSEEMSFVKINDQSHEKQKAKLDVSSSPHHSADPISSESPNETKTLRSGSELKTVQLAPGGLPPDTVSSRMGRKTGGMTEFEKMLLNLVKSNIDRAPRPPDPDEMFFLSQMPQIKALSSADLRDFKQKFMDLLKCYTTFYD